MQLASPSLLSRRKHKMESLSTSMQKLSIKPSALRRQLSIETQVTPLSGVTDHTAYPKTEDLIQINQESHLDQHRQEEVLTTKAISGLSDAFEQCFEVGQKIGEGAHGVVRRCTHRQTQKQFAVKIMLMEDEHFRFLKTNFINMKQLKSDHIIKYKALFLNTKTRLCHLVMEYLPYPSLKPSLTETSLRYVFYKVLDGLTYIHKKHLCHRDIKPDNIVFDETSGIVKIVDFGVSKNMNIRGRYELMLTNTGTLAYKAPEMFEGSGYSERVDAWAVGVSIYEMITGVTPFVAEYLKDTIESIQSVEPDLQHPAFENYSPLVKDLLGNLLKKNPKQRMKCQQAKNHLWFNPHLHDIDFMKSAGIPFKLDYLESGSGLPYIPHRRDSVPHRPKEQEVKPSQEDKLLMKGWLSELGKSGAPEDEYKYDLVDSDNEENKQQQILPHSNYMSLTVIPGLDGDSPTKAP